MNTTEVKIQKPDLFKDTRKHNSQRTQNTQNNDETPVLLSFQY